MIKIATWKKRWTNHSRNRFPPAIPRISRGEKGESDLVGRGSRTTARVRRVRERLVVFHQQRLNACRAVGLREPRLGAHID
jgi:hypothetical protein